MGPDMATGRTETATLAGMSLVDRITKVTALAGVPLILEVRRNDTATLTRIGYGAGLFDTGNLGGAGYGDVHEIGDGVGFGYYLGGSDF